MDIFTVGLWVGTSVFLIFSILKNKRKTFESMGMANSMIKNMIGEIIAILFLIGLILTFIPPEIIKNYMGKPNIVTSTMISAIVGAITLIPAFVAFPLAGSLIDQGAHIMPVIAFLTTLTMVGIVTFPLEKREFGMKLTGIRNALSFIFAIVISLIMGVFF